MKVKELIDKLQACPSDYEVFFADVNRGYASPILDEQEEFCVNDDEQDVTIYWYTDAQH